jgi:hypothetical protein
MLLFVGLAACGRAEPLTAEPRRTPFPRSTTSAVVSASALAPAVLPTRIDVLITDRRGGSYQARFEGDIEDCLRHAAVGDAGTLIVTPGPKGWAEPALEIEGLTQPFVRCLMSYVMEAVAGAGGDSGTMVYVSAQ